MGLSQENKIIEEKLKSTIQIQLVTAGDTLDMEKDFPISLLITNKSRKALFIPLKTDLESNLYPNGTDEIWNGAIVNLKIEPMSGFASILKETLC